VSVREEGVYPAAWLMHVLALGAGVHCPGRYCSCQQDARGWAGALFILSDPSFFSCLQCCCVLAGALLPQGTITHMSPERLATGRNSPAADVFAFGVMSKLIWPAVVGHVEQGGAAACSAVSVESPGDSCRC
jgi:hypothetical protein